MENKADADIIAAVDKWRKKPDLKTACPICSSKKWAVGFVCELPEQLTGEPFGVVPLRCCHCSYVLFLSALHLLGLMKPEA
jgi:hypothetical protein